MFTGLQCGRLYSCVFTKTALESSGSVFWMKERIYEIGFDEEISEYDN